MVCSRASGAALMLLAFAAAGAAQETTEEWKQLMLQGGYAEEAHDHTKAEQTYVKALHEAERFGPYDSRVGTTLNGLAGVYLAEKKFTDAENACRRALLILANVDADSIDVAEVNFNFARIQLAQSRYAESIPFIRKTLASYEKLFGADSLKTADVLCLLGDSYRATKAFEEAEQPLRRCADIRETDGGIQNPALAEALHSLALTYAGEGKYQLVEARFKLAEKIRENTLGITSLLLAQTLEDHAAFLKLMGRDREAKSLLLMSAAIRRNQKK